MATVLRTRFLHDSQTCLIDDWDVETFVSAWREECNSWVLFVMAKGEGNTRYRLEAYEVILMTLHLH